MEKEDSWSLLNTLNESISATTERDHNPVEVCRTLPCQWKIIIKVRASESIDILNNKTIEIFFLLIETSSWSWSPPVRSGGSNYTRLAGWLDSGQ